MNRWSARDTAMTVFMGVILLFMVLQMIQSDRLYSRVNDAIDAMAVVRQSMSSQPSSYVSPAPPGVSEQATASPKARSPKAATEPTSTAAASAVKKDVGGWLIRSIQQPKSLNPLLATDAYESIVNGFVLESLLDRDNQTFEFIPRLANRWEISEDKLNYRFFLDPRARWQDGSSVTSDDVIFTYETIMDPNIPCAHLKNYYKDISECKAIDNLTVEFTYKTLYWRALTFCGGMRILSRAKYGYKDPNEFIESELNRASYGSGPFRFAAWKTGEEIALERNPNYWRRETHPAIGRIVFRFFDNDQSKFQALRAEQVDFASITAEQWVKQTADKEFLGRFNKHRYLSNGYNYIGWNSSKPFFSDRRVRRAMTHLVPRELILDKIMHNLGKIVTGNFNSKTEAFDHTIQPLRHDPEEAKRLLDEAGWIDSDSDGIRDKDGTPFRFELLIRSGGDTYRKIASIFQDECRRVGVEANPTMLEWAVFLEKIDKREFDAVSLGWSMGLEADPYQIWHSTQIKPPGHNFVSFQNSEADQIIVDARQEFDEAKRNRMFHRFHRIIHEEQPYTFLFVPMSLNAVQNRFHNVSEYPNGLDSSEWYVPTKLQRY